MIAPPTAAAPGPSRGGPAGARGERRRPLRPGAMSGPSAAAPRRPGNHRQRRGPARWRPRGRGAGRRGSPPWWPPRRLPGSRPPSRPPPPRATGAPTPRPAGWWTWAATGCTCTSRAHGPRGRPTVLLDAGIGSCSPHWAWVQAELAPSTRVVAYDRAGLGWSDPGPRPARRPAQRRRAAHRPGAGRDRRAVRGGGALLRGAGGARLRRPVPRRRRGDGPGGRLPPRPVGAHPGVARGPAGGLGEPAHRAAWPGSASGACSTRRRGSPTGCPRARPPSCGPSWRGPAVGGQRRHAGRVGGDDPPPDQRGAGPGRPAPGGAQRDRAGALRRGADGAAGGAAVACPPTAPTGPCAGRRTRGWSPAASTPSSWRTPSAASRRPRARGCPWGRRRSRRPPMRQEGARPCRPERRTRRRGRGPHPGPDRGGPGRAARVRGRP